MRARDPDAVEVYSSAPPARPHVDVALLEATQTEGLNEQSTSLMVRRLREQAASMGCDALLLGGMSQRSGAPLGSDFSALDPGSRTLPATCIVYVEPGAGAVAGDAESDASARSEK